MGLRPKSYGENQSVQRPKLIQYKCKDLQYYNTTRSYSHFWLHRKFNWGITEIRATVH